MLEGGEVGGELVGGVGGADGEWVGCGLDVGAHCGGRWEVSTVLDCVVEGGVG